MCVGGFFVIYFEIVFFKDGCCFAYGTDVGEVYSLNRFFVVVVYVFLVVCSFRLFLFVRMMFGVVVHYESIV